MNRNPSLTIGIGTVTFLALAALFVPWLTERSPVLSSADSFGEPLPPQLAFPCGTDELGRDVCVRILYAGRISLGVAVVATAVAISMGGFVGCVAGYYGGLLDTVLMRCTEVFLAIPVLLLAIALAALFEPSTFLMLTVIGFVSWASVARAVRAEVCSLKTREFVLAANALGAGNVWILWRHILPSLRATLLSLAAVTASQSLLIDAGLSFIGLGVPPPTPSWGRMLSESQAYYRVAPWLMLFPGAMLTLAVLGFQLVGSGVIRGRRVP